MVILKSIDLGTEDWWDRTRQGAYGMEHQTIGQRQVLGAGEYNLGVVTTWVGSWTIVQVTEIELIEWVDCDSLA